MGNSWQVSAWGCREQTLFSGKTIPLTGGKRRACSQSNRVGRKQLRWKTNSMPSLQNLHMQWEVAAELDLRGREADLPSWELTHKHLWPAPEGRRVGDPDEILTPRIVLIRIAATHAEISLWPNAWGTCLCLVPQQCWCFPHFPGEDLVVLMGK